MFRTILTVTLLAMTFDTVYSQDATDVTTAKATADGLTSSLSDYEKVYVTSQCKFLLTDAELYQTISDDANALIKYNNFAKCVSAAKLGFPAIDRNGHIIYAAGYVSGIIFLIIGCWVFRQEHAQKKPNKLTLNNSRAI